jgi:hypothetical protein
MQSVFCRAARRLVATHTRIIRGAAATVGKRRIALNRYPDAPPMGIECGSGVRGRQDDGRGGLSAGAICADAAAGSEWRRGRKSARSFVAPRSSDTRPVMAAAAASDRRDDEHTVRDYEVFTTAGAAHEPTSPMIAIICPS